MFVDFVDQHVFVVSDRCGPHFAANRVMGCDGWGGKQCKSRYDGKDGCFDFGEVFWHGIENQYTDKVIGCFVVYEFERNVMQFLTIYIAKLKV